MWNNTLSDGFRRSQRYTKRAASESEEDVTNYSGCSNVTSDGSIPKLILCITTNQQKRKMPKLQCSIRAPEVKAANTVQVQKLNPCTIDEPYQYNQAPAQLILNQCIEKQCMEKEISVQQSAAPAIYKHTERCYYSDAEFEDRIQNVLFTKERLELELTNQKSKLPLVKGEKKSQTTPSQVANHPIVLDYLVSQRLLAESMRVRFFITCDCLTDDVKAALVLEEEQKELQRRKEIKLAFVNGSHNHNHQISEKSSTDSCIREQENSCVLAMNGETSLPSADSTASKTRDIDNKNSLNSELEFGTAAPVAITNGHTCNSDYEDQPPDLSNEIGIDDESSLNDALAIKTGAISSESNTGIFNGIVKIPTSEYSHASELYGMQDHKFSLRLSLSESSDESLGRTFKDLSDSSSDDDSTDSEKEGTTTGVLPPHYSESDNPSFHKIENAFDYEME